VSAVDTSRPDTIARRPQFRKHRGHRHSVRRLRQHAVRRTPWSGQPPASRFRCRRGHRRRRLASTAVAGGACMDGRPPATAMSLPCSGALRRCPRRKAAVRPPAGRNPGRPADTAAVSSPADALGCGPGRRSRQTSVVQMCDRGRGLRTPATRRRPARWTPATAAGHTDTAAWIGGHCGSGLLDSRQRNRPLPLACPAGNGTARCGIGQHRHGQTARSVGWWSTST
jgi:hypothetical protein